MLRHENAAVVLRRAAVTWSKTTGIDNVTLWIFIINQFSVPAWAARCDRQFDCNVV